MAATIQGCIGYRLASNHCNALHNCCLDVAHKLHKLDLFLVNYAFQYESSLIIHWTKSSLQKFHWQVHVERKVNCDVQDLVRRIIHDIRCVHLCTINSHRIWRFIGIEDSYTCHVHSSSKSKRTRHSQNPILKHHLDLSLRSRVDRLPIIYVQLTFCGAILTRCHDEFKVFLPQRGCGGCRFNAEREHNAAFDV